MAIIGALPVTLNNGTTADASQVMADLNFIVNAVNSGAMPANVTTLDLASLTATTVDANTVDASDGVYVPSNGIQFAGNQGAYMVWNEVSGSGATSLVNNQGGGTGGFIFRNINLANTAETGRVTIDAAGDITAGGNVGAYSDERLKKDWEPLKNDFLESLADVRSGTYSRIDNGLRQVGVSAQALQPFLPEAVLEDSQGVLSVAYGQAALVACVELAKEVLRLRALLEPVK